MSTAGRGGGGGGFGAAFLANLNSIRPRSRHADDGNAEERRPVLGSSTPDGEGGGDGRGAAAASATGGSLRSVGRSLSASALTAYYGAAEADEQQQGEAAAIGSIIFDGRYLGNVPGADDEEESLAYSGSEHDDDDNDDDDDDGAVLAGALPPDRPETPRAGEPPQEQQEEEEEATGDTEDAVTSLTNRLRCLFTVLTLPIIPIGTVLSLLLLFVLYAAFVTDLHHTCSEPLHGYALVSLALFAYAPHHRTIKMYLFHYSRERDGPVRPRGVRIYDQLFQTLCLLYVYGGLTLVSTCGDDLTNVPVGGGGGGGTAAAAAAGAVADAVGLGPHDASAVAAEGGEGGGGGDGGGGGGDFPTETISTCAATCPALYAATRTFVTALEMFAVVLVLPLLCLPCVYVWVVRRSSAVAALAELGRNGLNDEDGGFGGDDADGFYTAAEILDGMDRVELFRSRPPSSKGGGGGDSNSNTNKICVMATPPSCACAPAESPDAEAEVQVEEGRGGLLAPSPQPSAATYLDYEDVRECCICMSEFRVADYFVGDDDDRDGLMSVPTTTGVTYTDMSRGPGGGNSLVLADEQDGRDEAGGIFVDGPMTSTTTTSPVGQHEQSSSRSARRRRRSQQGADADANEEDDPNSIVRTKCGHFFHRSCLGGWLGGQWQGGDGGSRRSRRVRRRCCPLCREDMAPDTPPLVDDEGLSPLLDASIV